MGSLQEFQKQLRAKDMKISHLEKELKEKEEIIQKLTSELDKYKSIFKPRKQRGVGISAEPAGKQLHDLTKSAIKTYSKPQRYVCLKKTCYSTQKSWDK